MKIHRKYSPRIDWYLYSPIGKAITLSVNIKKRKIRINIDSCFCLPADKITNKGNKVNKSKCWYSRHINPELKDKIKTNEATKEKFK